MAKASGKFPDALKNQPELPFVLDDYFRAFFKLHARRQYTMGGELPLQVAEIEGYARIHGFTGDMVFFYRCVTECDLEFFEYVKEKREQEGKNKPKPTAPPRRAPRRTPRRR